MNFIKKLKKRWMRIKLLFKAAPEERELEIMDAYLEKYDVTHISENHMTYVVIAAGIYLKNNQFKVDLSEFTDEEKEIILSLNKAMEETMYQRYVKGSDKCRIN